MNRVYADLRQRLVYLSPIGAVGVVAGLSAALGIGFDPTAAIVFGLLMGVSVVISGSWSRAVLSVLIGMGFTSVVLVLLIRGGLAEKIGGISPESFFALTVPVTVLLASVLIRRTNTDLILHARVRAAELAGLLSTALIGLVLAVKVNHAQNLLFLLLQAEDNEAWVRMQTRVSTSNGLGYGLLDYGASVISVIGYVTTNLPSTSYGPNAVWGTYALLLIFTPSLLGLIVAKIGQPSQRLFSIAIVLLAVLLFTGSFFRFAQYGHLTATLSLVALIAIIGFVIEVEKNVRTTIALFALVAFFSMCWFPFALFGVAVLIYWVILTLREASHGGRIFLGAFCAVGLVFAVLPIRFLMNGGPSGVITSLRDLYSIAGGSPQVDGFVLVLTLSGLVGFSFFRLRLTPHVSGMLDLAALLVIYGTVAYGTGLVLIKAVGYAQQKISVIVVVSLMLVVVMLLSSMRVDARSGILIVLSIVFGSLFVGGASGDVLARTWPLGGEDPAWVNALSNAVNAQAERGDQPHPVFCLTSDVKVTYDCYRWSQGLTGTQSATLGAISSAVFAGGDPAASVASIISTGEIDNLDVVVLDPAAVTQPWQRELLDHAHAVVDMSGKPSSVR